MTARDAQRRRTRAAIVAAARELLEQGQTPSLSEVADAADVSRRTVYLHFPTVEQLLIDATVGALSQRAVDEAIEAADPGGDDAEARVDAMIDALAALSSDTLPLGSTLIRLTVDAPSTGQEAPRRGYRRVDWIERAIEPLRAQLPTHEFERLLSGLAMVIGWEALVVLQDIRGLSARAQIETSRWAARALIAAAVSESS
jgi:AcrR family transcriptional regulator